MHRILKANPLFTDLLTSWSGKLSKPTWPAKRSCRPSAPLKQNKIQKITESSASKQHLFRGSSTYECSAIIWYCRSHFNLNVKSKETPPQLLMNILWEEWKISRFGQRLLLIPSPSPTNIRSFQIELLAFSVHVNLCIFLCKEFIRRSSRYPHCRRNFNPEQCSRP